MPNSTAPGQKAFISDGLRGLLFLLDESVFDLLWRTVPEGFGIDSRLGLVQISFVPSRLATTDQVRGIDLDACEDVRSSLCRLRTLGTCLFAICALGLATSSEYRLVLLCFDIRECVADVYVRW